jgi:hypothetical protein
VGLVEEKEVVKLAREVVFTKRRVGNSSKSHSVAVIMQLNCFIV